jgi:capsular polysaccharide transport system ATP-binding protein
MIVLDNVTKFFKVKRGRKYILKNVSLSIPGKTNVGILGRNGAGKTTLLRMIGGIDFPNSGTISSSYNFSWPLGLVGGYQGSLTGRQNAKFVCRINHLSEGDIMETVAQIHAFSELGNYFDMPVKTYSTGMRARLGFSISLAFEFDYYLVDETLTVGDQKFRKKCTAALANLREKSHMLLVAHNMIALKQLCQTGIVLEDGEMSYFDNITDAVDYYQSK